MQTLSNMMSYEMETKITKYAENPRSDDRFRRGLQSKAISRYAIVSINLIVDRNVNTPCKNFNVCL